MNAVGATPRVGRPRSTAADDAIRDATLAVFADRGFDGLAVEAVAERAGVAKSTLYRRFPCKLDLVRHALASVTDELPCPHTDSLVDDLVALVTELRDRFGSDTIGRFVPALVQAAARHTELRALHHRFVAERRRRGLARLEAAVEQGELPAGTDVELLVDQLGAVVFYRAFVSGGDTDDATLRSLVELTVEGHRVRGGDA